VLESTKYLWSFYRFEKKLTHQRQEITLITAPFYAGAVILDAGASCHPGSTETQTRFMAAREIGSRGAQGGHRKETRELLKGVDLRPASRVFAFVGTRQ
jgi:hypothetical protein